jgi:hypothetical protein
MDLKRRIEAGLFKRGFTNPDVRELVAVQTILCLGVCLIAAVAGWFQAHAWHFAVGTVLVTLNLYSMAKYAQRLVMQRNAVVIRLLAGFYARLALTAIALYVLIIVLNVSVTALLAGLSTVVATIVVWGLGRSRGGKAKEA